MRYYLAIDIGASSGRHILCRVDEGRLVCEEIYRFKNGVKESPTGSLIWDTESIFSHVVEGMKRCRQCGKIPVSVAIDTWGVDFVLIDKDGSPIGEAVSYRDSRTDGVSLPISDEELYSRTGIQKQKFNTIYQLAYLAKEKPQELMAAETLLMMPDYLNFRLTGIAMQEYTNATTTGLVGAHSKSWDMELIDKLGLPRRLFGKITSPATVVGRVRPEIEKAIGYSPAVYTCASHDTASAVMAVPTQEEDFLYISSGTWSLMGVENKAPICTQESRRCNFTNEGGFGGTYRYLKNIMGLWMIQELRRECGGIYSFAELCEMAESSECESLVDPACDRFLAPVSMKAEIASYCREHNADVPITAADFARVIYRSLAKCYAECVLEIERMTGKKFSRIHIIGGGSNADYLNRLTRDETGCDVYAGPGEATAFGNIAAQLIADGVCRSLSEVRQMLYRTFDLKIYESKGV